MKIAPLFYTVRQVGTPIKARGTDTSSTNPSHLHKTWSSYVDKPCIRWQTLHTLTNPTYLDKPCASWQPFIPWQTSHTLKDPTNLDTPCINWQTLHTYLDKPCINWQTVVKLFRLTRDTNYAPRKNSVLGRGAKAKKRGGLEIENERWK